MNKSLFAVLLAGIALLGGCGPSDDDDALQAGSIATTTTGPNSVPGVQVGEAAQTADWKVTVRSVLDPYVPERPTDDDGFNIPVLSSPPPGERLIQVDIVATNTRSAPQTFPETNVGIENGAGESWGPEGVDAPWSNSRFPPVAPGETTIHRYFFLVRDDDQDLTITFEPIRLTGPKVRIPLR